MPIQTIIRVAFGVFGVLLFAPALHAQTLPEIPPQPLVDALETWGKQTGKQLIYRAAISKGVESMGSPAGATTDEALSAILRNTELAAAWVNERTVTIVRADALAGSQPGPGAIYPDHAAPGPQKVSPVKADLPSWEALEEVGAVQVIGSSLTGSHLNVSVPQLETISSEDIGRSGYATVYDVARTFSLSFSGGPHPQTRIGIESANNATLGAGFNLRGLGSAATLVLLNGTRLPAVAGHGRFVDVSGIPLSAIDRIEILRDGASAVYGADAVGGVVNLILRDDIERAETHAYSGFATGGPRETTLAQLFGKEWSSGRSLISLELHRQERLESASRAQTATSDLRRWGGDDHRVLTGSPGTITDPASGQTWAIPDIGRRISAGDLVPGTVNLHNQRADTDVLPDHKRANLMATVRQVWGKHRFYADTLITLQEKQFRNGAHRRPLLVPPSNPWHVHPTDATSPVVVLYGFERDLGPVADTGEVDNLSLRFGATFALSENWELTAEATGARSQEHAMSNWLIDEQALGRALADPNEATAFNAFGGANNPQTLAVIRQEGVVRRSAEITTANLTARGAVWRLADRDIQLALGAEMRQHSVDSFAARGRDTIRDATFHRTVASAYGELSVPLIYSQPLRGLHDAQLSIAARHEQFSDFGSSTVPKVTLSWAPTRSVKIQTSWAKSFRAPHLIDLDESINILGKDLQRDSGTPSGKSPVIIWAGGNRDLNPETAESRSLSATFNIPSRRTTARISAFDITYRGQAREPEYSPNFLEDEIYAGMVTRNPTAAQREEACSRGTFIRGDADDCRNAPIAALVDMRIANLASLRTSGLEFEARHEYDSSFGRFWLELDAIRLFDFSEAQYPNSPKNELLGTVGKPLDLRLRGLLAWRYRQLELVAAMNYAAGYRDTISNPSRRIDPWITTDLKLTYQFSAHESAMLENTSLSIIGVNAFDEAPPFVNNGYGIGYDPENADIVGRRLALRLQKDW